MKFNRRDLLKFFGAGSAIVPVVAGIASMEVQARLIEEPKIEIAKPPEIVEASTITSGEYEATVYLRHIRSNQTARQFSCTVFAADVNPVRLQVGFPALCARCGERAHPRDFVGTMLTFKDPKRVTY